MHFQKYVLSVHFLGNQGRVSVGVRILSQEIQPEEIPYKFNCATYNLQMWKGLSCYENEPDFIRNFCVGSRCMA